MNKRLWIRGLSPLVAVAGLVAGIVQSGCEGDHTGLKPFQVPEPVVTDATYMLLVEPFNEQREYPRAAEVLVDGEIYWTGPIEAPALNGYAFYYGGIPSSLVIERREELSAGSHNLTFRVTDQQRSPTGYYISGYVDVIWGGSHVVRVAAWETVLVNLRTGEDWTIPFVVPPSL